PGNVAATGRAMVDNALHVVQMTAEQAAAEQREPALAILQPQPVLHLRVAYVVPIAAERRVLLGQQRHGFVERGDLVVVEPRLNAEPYAVAQRQRAEFVQAAPRRWQRREGTCCSFASRACPLRLDFRAGDAALRIE